MFNTFFRQLLQLQTHFCSHDLHALSMRYLKNKYKKRGGGGTHHTHTHQHTTLHTPHTHTHTHAHTITPPCYVPLQCKAKFGMQQHTDRVTREGLKVVRSAGGSSTCPPLVCNAASSLFLEQPPMLVFGHGDFPKIWKSRSQARINAE